MDYSKSPYFHIGRASELQGSDRFLYRFLEMLPAILSFGTIFGTFLLSKYHPTFASIFIIAFDLYWLLKTVYLSSYLWQNYKRTKHALTLNWKEMLLNIKYEHIYNMVIYPFYSESFETIEAGILSLINSNTDLQKIIVILAAEERRGKEGIGIAKKIEEKYANKFGNFLVTLHPKDTEGELAGKGANISYAAEEARIRVLDAKQISYEDVIVSAFDTDTVVYPEYFSCLTWHFLTAENPYRSSFQPVPFYNNNVWQAPMPSRVVAGSGTFWQMIEQERPERGVTFSSHAISFKTLYEVGYWQKNMVSDDSRIFWNAYMAFNGNYSFIPISYPVSMDANLASGFWQTMKNIYKQQRRWSWGAENIPYILFNFLKNKQIPLSKKIHVTFVQLEGYWSLATNPLMILLLGWLPLIFGGKNFNSTILSYNLPIITRDLMILAMLGLVVSSIVFLSFLPVDMQHLKKRHRFIMLIQWLLIPVTIIVFGAIPALDAQLRLFFGKYMGFWVTPKFVPQKDLEKRLEGKVVL